ncbi:host attachment protein [Devosia sp. A8/3-2]|nr:host attachment protein [Devosia sp. A8/3-2]
MKKTVTWILIADGTQARVLENTGPGKGLRQWRGWISPSTR